jgi:TRAP-type uncharacterized transport system substrate-binding protein
VQTTAATARPPQRPPAPVEERISAPDDAGILTVLSSEPDGAFPNVIAELDSALSQDRLRVFSSMLGRGTLQALRDLERLPDVDIAVVQADAIAALGEGPLRRRLRYIARLYNKELHVLAGRDITDLRQLHGRKVNIDRPGTGTHVMARTVFEKLGVAPDFTTDDQATSHQKLRSGEIAAAVYVAPRPAREVTEFQADGRFHLLAVPYQDEVRDYLPAELHARDYPNLIQGGRPVATVAVPTVLAVLNWPEGTERYGRLARFVDAYFSRFDEIREAARRGKWDAAPPPATVPGWQRFRPAQEWLDRSIAR